MEKHTDLTIVVIGAGAVGSSVAAWVAQHHAPTYLLARGPAAEVMRAQHGIRLVFSGPPVQNTHVPVRIVSHLAEAPKPDVVVIAVKLYDLERAAQMVKEAVGDTALVLGLQNGVANQVILPKYFSRVAYGIVSYNAWIEQPGVIGYQNLSPLVIGTPDNSLQTELGVLAEIFNRGVETVITRNLEDAVHCKVAVNLSNSVTTLLGTDPALIDDMDRYQNILSNVVYEGIQVIRSAGYHEERHEGQPSWLTIWAAAKLPQAFTRGVFMRNFRRLRISSMGQDVLERKKTVSELEYLNGYVLELAAKYRINVPYNRVIYRLCKQRFAAPVYQPMRVKEVWAEIRKERKLRGADD